MDDLERQLKDALAREEAPAGFEARVMNAVNQAAASKDGRPSRHFGERRPVAGRPHIGSRPRWQWIFATAAAAVAMVGGVGGEWEHHIAMERIKTAHLEMEEREAGEAAKAQLQLALRITSTKLREIQQKIGDQAH
jgi:hypothetical protein